MSAPPEEDPLALSSLDVLCCGLGATIYLFLIFSVMPHLGESRQPARTNGGSDGNRSGSPKGARLEEGSATPVFSALIRVHVRSDLSLPQHSWSWDRPRGQNAWEFATPSIENEPWISGITVPAGMRADKRLKFMLDRSTWISRAGSTFRVEVWVGGSHRHFDVVIPANPPAHDRPTLFELAFDQRPDSWLRTFEP